MLEAFPDLRGEVNLQWVDFKFPWRKARHNQIHNYRGTIGGHMPREKARPAEFELDLG